MQMYSSHFLVGQGHLPQVFNLCSVINRHYKRKSVLVPKSNKNRLENLPGSQWPERVVAAASGKARMAETAGVAGIVVATRMAGAARIVETAAGITAVAAAGTVEVAAVATAVAAAAGTEMAVVAGTEETVAVAGIAEVVAAVAGAAGRAFRRPEISFGIIRLAAAGIAKVAAAVAAAAE
jgi:hypothetical protein